MHNDNSSKSFLKEKPDFKPTGKLTESLLSRNGVPLKYAEPTEAGLPDLKWRVHVFKGSDQIKTLPIHRQSCYLLGRDDRVSDILLDHESCSKQHAILQYRRITRQLGPTEYEEATK